MLHKKDAKITFFYIKKDKKALDKRVKEGIY